MYRNINYRLIGHTIGKVLLFELVFMFLALLISSFDKWADWKAFIETMSITLLAGVLLTLINRKARFHDPGKKESFIAVTLSWIFISLLGALPYYLSHAVASFIDAFFESVSGFTTTGSSVIPDVESLSKGILFWRAETHWIGGMGIILLVIAIIPHYKMGAGHLIAAEGSMMGVEKIRPRIIDTAKHLWLIYIILTFLETVLLILGGLNWFDAVCHSFATVATGGFSTKNTSVANLSVYCQYIIIVFMFLSGINFALHYFGYKGQYKRIWKNEEFRLYLIIISVITLLVTIGIMPFYQRDIEASFRHAIFQIVSIITATGFSSADYTLWGNFPLLLVFITMFFGACVGSTGGGIKIARYNIVFKGVGYQFKRIISPNSVNVAKYNDTAIENTTFHSVYAFIFLYAFTFFLGSFIMAIIGLDWQSAASSVVTTLGGIGPGLGRVGPSNTFIGIPTFGKIYLSLNMIVGRLEIMSFLILFSPSFYKV